MFASKIKCVTNLRLERVTVLSLHYIRNIRTLSSNNCYLNYTSPSRLTLFPRNTKYICFVASSSSSSSSCGACCQGRSIRTYSTPSQGTTSSKSNANDNDNNNDSEPDPAANEESKRNEQKIRRYKKIFSTLLFSTTLIGVAFARRRKQHQLEENFQGCVRLPVDEEFKGSYREFFHCGKDKLTGKPGCVFPSQILKDGTLKAVKSFKVEPTDIFVASFPKTGTTWVQEIVYLIENNLDLTKASEKVLEDRFPYLEYPYPGLASVAKQSSPRLIKTHLPLDFLPDDVLNAKVIYITRNPKDTVVSYYHFARMLAFSSYNGSFVDFLRKFQENQIPYTPFFGHVESFKKQEDNPNLLILTYEELTRDPVEVIKKIAGFLEKPLADSDIRLLVEHTSFKEMASNPSVNYTHWDSLGIRNNQEANFMRKGKVGDWRNYFSERNNNEFNAWIKENNKMTVNFEYEI